MRGKREGWRAEDAQVFKEEMVGSRKCSGSSPTPNLGCNNLKGWKEGRATGKKKTVILIHRKRKNFLGGFFCIEKEKGESRER